MTAALDIAQADVLLGQDTVTIAQRHELWRRGNLSWLLHDGQMKARALVRNGQAKRYVLEIARRWGKSWFLCVEACETALSKPRSRIPYAASTQESLKEYILPIMVEIIETAPEELRPEIVGHEVRFKNGSRIVLQGCENRLNANRLRGPAAALAIVDEAGFIPPSVLIYVVKSILLYQLLTTRGTMLVASSPPESPAHAFTEFAVEAEVRGAHMHATIYDAPHLTPEAIAEACEESGGPESVSWQREGLAKRVVDPTHAIIPEFSALASVLVEDRESGQHIDRYIIGDLGFVDLAFVLFAEWDFASAMLYVVDEWSEPRVTTDVLQRAVDAKARARWGDAPIYRRIIDATARERADMVKLQEQDPTAANAWRAANNQEREVLVNRLRISTSRLRYRIHPRCEKLVKHLKAGTWNEQRTSFARVDGYGHFDGVAAMTYTEKHTDRTHNPAPPLRTTHYAQIMPGGVALPPGSDADRRLRLARAFERPRKR